MADLNTIRKVANRYGIKRLDVALDLTTNEEVLLIDYRDLDPGSDYDKALQKAIADGALKVVDATDKSIVIDIA